MFGFVLSLAVLSAMFALFGAAAILIRKSLLKGREGLMYPVWIFILVLSVLPLRVDLTAADAGQTTEQISGHDVETIGDTVGEDFSDAQSTVTVIRPRGGLSLTARLRLALNEIACRYEFISAVLFIIWIAGALVRFTVSMNDYRQAKKLLYCSSEDCFDPRFNALLDECRRDIGCRRRIRLRMLDSAGLCSPCVCGCINPVLYIEPGCESLSDTELRCVLLHELTHIRRCDMLLKLFTLFVTSVHWFNPMSGKVLKYVYEDCELACDSNVIRTYGSSVSGVYMTTILDFAERFSQRNRLIGQRSFDGGFFFAKSSNAAFLKRRYANMKNFRKSHAVIAVMAACAVAMGAANLFALSSCTSMVPGQFSGALELSPSVDRMVRAYYGLSEDDFITSEMLDGITTLTIKADKTYDGHILADFTVNGEEGYARAVPALALMNYWDSCIQPKVEEAVDLSNETSYYNDDGKLIKAVFGDKIFAFYCLKDPYDPELTERAAEEIKLTYPVIREKGSLYIFDPYSSEREIQTMYSCFDNAGLLDPWDIGSESFDASCLQYFRNLREVTFVGFKPVNYDFPAEVTLNEEPYDENADYFVYMGELLDLAEDSVYSDRQYIEYELPEDGSELAIPANDSLNAALREYFAMEQWDESKTPLTSKEAEQITSVKAEIDSDLTASIRAVDPGFFSNAVYVRYTINGVKLPLIPKYYEKHDFDSLFGGAVGKESVENLIRTYYTYSNEKDCYVRSDTIPSAAEREIFEKFSLTALNKAAVVGKYDSGAYELQFQSPSARISGMPARFIDSPSDFDESDRELFPNLTEWEIALK